VDALSAKPPEKKLTMAAPGKGSVSQLIEEAEELIKLLDRLGEKMGRDDIAGANGSAMLSVAS
jgi:hypothetical protein